MRICALQYKTTGVAGLNSELVAMYREGADRGDEWKVYETWPWTNQSLINYGERKLIRGGDVYLTVDGKLSHHTKFAESNAKYINENFDLLYLSGLCPHPNKSYGDYPHYLDLLKNITIPIVGRICDGYIDSYREWAKDALEYTEHCTIAWSYRSTVADMGIEGVHIPFYPEKPMKLRRLEKRLVWLSQWKNIKGIKQMIRAIPNITRDLQIHMYSNGIEYYQMRKDDWFRAAVGVDHFGGDEFSGGDGHAEFYGYVPLEHIPGILQTSWMMADFQGMGKAKYEVYNKGSINTTGIEALHYGCCPVVAENSIIPDELCLKVQECTIADEINVHAADPDWFIQSPERIGKSIAYVADNFLAGSVYHKLVPAMGGAVKSKKFSFIPGLAS